jgi:hypothetical protein
MDSSIIKGLAKVVQERDDEFERKLSTVKREIKNSLTVSLARDFSNELVKSYKENKLYAPGDMVRHRSGIFQAWGDTDLQPMTKDSGWVCVVNGVHDISLKSVGTRGRVLELEMSDGTVVQNSWKEPIPVHKGTWDGTQSYEEGDETMWNGCTWRCTASKSAAAEPGESDDWMMVAQRGKPGKQGVEGPQGEKGMDGERGSDADPIVTAKVLMRALTQELQGVIDARS